MNSLKGWRTLLFAVVIGVVGTLEAFDWVSLIPDAIEPFLVPIIPAVFIWLRKITNTALGQSE